MPDPVTGIVGATSLIGAGTSLISSKKQASAAKSASQTQAASYRQAAEEARGAYADIADLLQPYADVGEPALQQMMAASGLSGPRAQQAYISGIQAGPEFQALVRQGEESILQRAAATGGVRGGNVQGALAQYRPQVLSQLLQQQYSRLGGLADIGRQTTAAISQARENEATRIANALVGAGSAAAGGITAAGAAQAQGIQGIGQGLSSVLGGLAGGIGGTGLPAQPAGGFGGYSFGGYDALRGGIPASQSLGVFGF
jgi:hypothetical protein